MGKKLSHVIGTVCKVEANAFGIDEMSFLFHPQVNTLHGCGDRRQHYKDQVDLIAGGLKAMRTFDPEFITEVSFGGQVPLLINDLLFKGLITPGQFTFHGIVADVGVFAQDVQFDDIRIKDHGAG